jgi:hypothetical protein
MQFQVKDTAILIPDYTMHSAQSVATGGDATVQSPHNRSTIVDMVLSTATRMNMIQQSS